MSEELGGGDVLNLMGVDHSEDLAHKQVIQHSPLPKNKMNTNSNGFQYNWHFEP